MLFDFEKLAPNVRRIPFPKEGVHDLCGRKYLHKELPENWKTFWTSIFCSPKNFPAPTPMPMGRWPLVLSPKSDPDAGYFG